MRLIPILLQYQRRKSEESILIILQWHAYNLIAPTDILKASAIRRVTTESATGSTSSTRVHINLSIFVTAVDFDAQAGKLRAISHHV